MHRISKRRSIFGNDLRNKEQQLQERAAELDATGTGDEKY